MPAAVRRAFAAIRQPERARRIALSLWMAWAVVVWNVIFDHTIVTAGRQYLHAAAAASRSGPYVRIDDWMRPSVTRALRTATPVGVGIALAGALAVSLASRSSGSRPQPS